MDLDDQCGARDRRGGALKRWHIHRRLVVSENSCAVSGNRTRTDVINRARWGFSLRARQSARNYRSQCSVYSRLNLAQCAGALIKARRRLVTEHA